jgi:L-lactate transport
VAGQVAGVDPAKVAAMAGRQLPFLSVIVPFWIILIMDGFKGVRETWPAVLVAGVSFAVSQYFTSNYIGPELPDIISALVSLLALTLFLKVWKPINIFRFHKEEAEEEKQAHLYTRGQIIRAWSPFIILTIIVTIWSIPPFKALFAKDGPLVSTVLSFPLEGLTKLVIKTAPIALKDTPIPAVYVWNLISAAGTAALLSGILAMFLLGMKPKDGVTTFVETLDELKRPIYTIGTVLAFAFVANFSGLSSTLGLYLAGTGSAFPFFSPVLGWLGVFLTGSDTSSNALFCSLQAVTAQQLGLPELLAIGSNTSGGVTGKMISPQSIAVACAAVGLVGHESDLFRFTLKHSLLMVALVGVIVMLQAYVFPWMIPS